MGNCSVKVKNNQTTELKSISKSLKHLAHEREKEEKPEKLKIKQAIEKGNMKQARIHAKNMIRMKTEVMTYGRISSRLDSMIDNLDDEPALSNSVPEIVEAIDSSLATGNLKKMLETMDRIEKQFFGNKEEAVVEEKSTKNSADADTCTSVVVPKEDQINSLIQEVADEYKLKISWADDQAIPIDH
ncbi:Snf7 [Macleaya cordata]|uniref:Snf7 n=1 Tax=Macleaya cordata TaxID=56857 RepID=A0A200QMU5_MACCD|nr:Snf7 [Macleaya cordata]